MSSDAAALMAALLVAHFLGDFTPLATARMLQAKALGRPVGPIAVHALVHAVLVALAVAFAARPGLAMVGAAAAIEFGTHSRDRLDTGETGREDSGAVGLRRPGILDGTRPRPAGARTRAGGDRGGYLRTRMTARRRCATRA